MSIAPQIRSAADALLARLTDDLRQHVDQTVAEIAEAAEATETARAEQAESAAEARQQLALDALKVEHAAALAASHEEVAAIRAEADAALADAEAAVAQALAEARAQAEQSHAAALVDSAQLAQHDAVTRLSSLVRAIAAMDEATTLSTVLDGLAEGLAAQAPRSAVLVFRGDAARVWRRAGFADTTEAPELTVADHADLTAIVESASPTVLEGQGDNHALLGIATLAEGESGLAVPVAIGGQVAALVYADAGDLQVALYPGWREVVEVLARHAARCLEALTAMRASGYARPQRPAVVVPMPPHLRIVERPTLETSVGEAIEQAQRVARLLVSEIRLNREVDIRQGREAGDLGDRLGGDIERARLQYLARVSEAVPGRDALFEDEVIRTLASGDASLLRRPTGS